MSSINADNGVVSGITGIRTTADSTGNLALQSNGVTVLTLATNNTATFAGNVTTAGLIVGTTALGAGNATRFKNRIINGDMRFDQRNSGASITPTAGVYCLDRFVVQMTQASKFSVQQNAGAVTPPTGFTNYLGCTSLSAYSVLAGDIFYIGQVIEGFNIADLGFGTASSKTFTVSFWVRSSLTGTFGGSLLNDAANRSYPFTYTISAANTWEQKSITVIGDTTGTWATNNSGGLIVALGLGAGSTYSATAGSWQAGFYLSATGAVSVVGTSGATFYITGVQLEVGSSATGFEYIDYTTQLAMCQRYCQSYGGAVSNQILGVAWEYSTSGAVVACLLPVVMRTTPSLTYSAVGNWVVFSGGAGGPYAVTSIGLNRASPTSMSVEFVASSLTAGQAGAVLANNTTSARIFLSAEL